MSHTQLPSPGHISSIVVTLSSQADTKAVHTLQFGRANKASE